MNNNSLLNKALPWIASAIQSGIAISSGPNIILSRIYLSTLGVFIEGSTLFLDVNSERDWIASAEIKRDHQQLFFKLESIYFVLPLSRDISNISCVIVSQNDRPLGLQMVKPAVLTRPIFPSLAKFVLSSSVMLIEN